MRIIALATAAALATACPIAAQEYEADTVLATVNGKDITLGHLIVLLGRLPEQYQSLGDDVLYPGMLDQLIDQTLIAQSVSDAPENDSKTVQLTLDNERIAILANQAIGELANQEAPEEELQAAYDARIADFQPAQEYNASHILVETKEEADAVVATLSGGADFAELAREKSTGPSGPNGGNLGWFGEGAMVPAFEAAVVSLDVGAVSDPVQTQFGFHVVKLNDSRMTQPPSIDDLRAELTESINRDRAEKAVQALRDKAEIERPELEIPFSAIRELDLVE